MDMMRRNHIDMSAPATVAPVRLAFRLKRLPFVGMAAVAAVAGFYMDYRFVDKHDQLFSPEEVEGEEELLSDFVPILGADELLSGFAGVPEDDAPESDFAPFLYESER